MKKVILGSVLAYLSATTLYAPHAQQAPLSPGILHEVARAGNIIRLNQLLTQVGSIDIKNAEGETPLVHLVKNFYQCKSDEIANYFATIMALIRWEASVTTKDGDGFTAYDYACKYKESEVYKGTQDQAYIVRMVCEMMKKAKAAREAVASLEKDWCFVRKS